MLFPFSLNTGEAVSAGQEGTRALFLFYLTLFHGRGEVSGGVNSFFRELWENRCVL